MKTPSPPPPKMLNDTEQQLLKAARDFQKEEPPCAVDAAILRAAAVHTAQARAAATPLQETQKPALTSAPPSLLFRLSRWLFGDGQKRGHLWQLAGLGALVGVVAVGLLSWLEFGVSANALVGAQYAAYEKQASPPLEFEKKTLERFGQNNAESFAPAPAPADAAPASSFAEKAERLAAVRAEATPARPVPPAPMTAGAPTKAARQKMKSAAATLGLEHEVEMDTQLKGVLTLRREGKEEEAKALLQQLKERYPQGNLDERLRRLETLHLRETEENK